MSKHDERCIDQTTCQGMIDARDQAIHRQAGEIAELQRINAELRAAAERWLRYFDAPLAPMSGGEEEAILADMRAAVAKAKGATP